MGWELRGSPTDAVTYEFYLTCRKCFGILLEKGTGRRLGNLTLYKMLNKAEIFFRSRKSHLLSRPESNDLDLHWMFPPKMCRKPEVLFYSWRVSVFRQQRTLPDVLKWAASCYLYLDRFNRSTFYRFSAVNGCCFRAQVFSAVFFIHSHGQWNPYPVWFRG